jgi:hypothetical protein
MHDHVLELVTVDGQKVQVTDGEALRAVGEGLARRHPEVMAGGTAATATLVPIGLVATLSVCRIEAQG